MATQLRHLAVHVTEPKAGAFRWVLTELSDEHTWSELQSADVQSPTYHQAMADGLVALQALVPDLEAGPQTATAARPTTHRKSPPHEETGAGTARRSVFGFGLAN